MDLLKYVHGSLKGLFCITVITITVNGDRSRCPTSVQKSRSFVATFNNTCYLFINSEKFWDEARQYCWRAGGEMLYIKNAATMNFIRKTLDSKELGWSKNGVWLGASDLRNRGWEWTTGERLKYTYWASGQPSSFLGLLSFENCACMRRGDGWRWHDFHCRVDGLEYNFICQFPFVSTQTVVSTKKGAPLEVDRGSDDRVAVICLAVAGFVLLIILCAISFLLYRKHERQKAAVVTSTTIRFRNAGYATIMRDAGRDTHSNRDGSDTGDASRGGNRADRPVSNVYLEPREVTRIYEEVHKDTDHGVNSLAGQVEGMPLVQRGGAAAIDDIELGAMSNSPSEASGATSGYCSGTFERRADDSDYIEMNGDNSLGNVSAHSPVNGCSGVNGPSPSKCEGATGKGTYQNGTKCTNLYVTPTACTNSAPGHVNKDNGCDAEAKPCNLEMHIYTNQTEQAEFEKVNQRPLPPVPGL